MIDCNDEEDIVYQCDVCQYIIRQKIRDVPPSYCPNCALSQKRGRMEPVYQECLKPAGAHENIHK